MDSTTASNDHHKYWYTRRCVLIGDTAHPTSPHLGQGANQALVDCYRLATLLSNFDVGLASMFKPGNVFKAFAKERQPVTAALVKGARRIGEMLVVNGVEACRVRDDVVRKSFLDVEGIEARYDALMLRQPYETNCERAGKLRSSRE